MPEIAAPVSRRCRMVGTPYVPLSVAGFCLVYSWEKKKNNRFFCVLKCFGM